MVVYIDDILVLAGSKQLIEDQVHVSGLVGMFGIHDQQEKINLRANSITGFPWNGSKYINGIKTTWGKLKKGFAQK